MARTRFASVETYQVLRTLTRHESKHGYAIVKETGVAQGTVYPILKRLEEAGHATSEKTWGDVTVRKTYKLTTSGIALFERRKALWASKVDDLEGPESLRFPEDEFEDED